MQSYVDLPRFEYTCMHSEPEIFISLTEKELEMTLGNDLVDGKEAIVRNINRCRELYMRDTQEYGSLIYRLLYVVETTNKRHNNAQLSLI